MRNKLNLIIACVLLVGSVFAEQGFDSVEDVMDELMNYTGERAPTPEKAPADPSADVSDEASAKAEAPAKAETTPEPTVKPAVPPAAVESGAGSATSVAPVEKKPELSREEKIAALVENYSGSMDTDKLLSLIDQINRSEGNAADAMQELADLIKKSKPQKDGVWEYLPALLKSEQRWTHLWTLLMSEPRKHTVETEAIDAVDAAWSMDLVLRSFPLVPGAGKRMKLGDATSAVDVEMLFSQVGFPQGASAIYQPETETLFINNTRDNLAVLESMLKTMGVLKGFGHSEQVEIEAKFVEVSEGTLEELGFQWNFADPTRAGGLDVNDGSSGLFNTALRGNPSWGQIGVDNSNPFNPKPIYGYIPKDLPFGRRMDLGDGFVSPSGDWSSFRFVDTFNTQPGSLSFKNTGGNEFELLISALDQNSGADVLSAPRVLTRSGEEATIQVGEIHYFPEVFEGDTAQATIPNVSYEDFEEKLLGVELTVTPKVNDEREIMLELNPRITELAGWQSYQLVPGAADGSGSVYNHRQLEARLPFKDHAPIVGNLPIFKKREIETQVTMADGSTIGMGGLINEKIEKFEDKVPVLGSIPMVGRLFRSEGERAVKRNLLMFVTANIIDPNGQVDASRSFE